MRVLPVLIFQVLGKLARILLETGEAAPPRGSAGRLAEVIRADSEVYRRGPEFESRRPDWEKGLVIRPFSRLSADLLSALR
jgi:hypothetical protein